MTWSPMPSRLPPSGLACPAVGTLQRSLENHFNEVRSGPEQPLNVAIIKSQSRGWMRIDKLNSERPFFELPAQALSPRTKALDLAAVDCTVMARCINDREHVPTFVEQRARNIERVVFAQG